LKLNDFNRERLFKQARYKYVLIESRFLTSKGFPLINILILAEELMTAIFLFLSVKFNVNSISSYSSILGKLFEA
jgi:hypothetical protein